MRSASQTFLTMGIVLISAAIGLVITGTSMTGEATGETVISMGDNFFAPEAINVAAGTTVQWRNDGQLPHTATSDPGTAGTFDSDILRSGETYSLTLDTPGAYAYRCSVHPEMVGAIVVEPAAEPEAPADDLVDEDPAAPPPAQDSQGADPPNAPGSGDAALANALPPPESDAGALPVGGGPPPISGDLMSAALLLSIGGGALVIAGIITMTLAAKRSAS